MTYHSLVDWTPSTDYLCCNPKFHGCPRYDFVIADLGQELVFAELVFIFTCKFDEQTHRLALVQPLKKSSRASVKEADKAASIHRWQARDRKYCEVIPLDCIVRGAVLVKDPKYKGDYLVINMLDGDMYLRLKQRSSWA